MSYQVPTPLPRAPSHIGGLVAIDGRVVTVLDLVALLQLDPDPSAPSRLVVVDLGGEPVAVLAHEVTGVLDIVPADGADALRGNPVLASVTERVGEAQGALLWCLDAAGLNRLARERT